jgi:nucleotide-binding universal stress UspA family protein
MTSEPVVVGVDGSSSALRAVRWAAGIAVRDGVPLRLVHAYTPTPQPPAGITEEEPLLGAPRTRGQHWIDESRKVAAEVDPALPVEVVLVAAQVANTLLHESATASMLALGTRRLSALTGLLVGSTSVTVAGHADCPVVIVRGPDPDEAPRETGPVVVGVDATTVSDSAIAFAFAEASVREAGLVAVHAWTEPVLETALAGGGGQLDLKTCRQEARDTLAARLAGWQEKYPDVPVRQDVVHDRPGRALSHYSHIAQLTVVGRRGRDAFPSLVLGSTSQYLLHHARCPVAVTKYSATEETGRRGVRGPAST